MKKLSNKQKTIIAVTCAFVLVFVSVFIVVKTVRNRTPKQEYERISTESGTLLSEITSETTLENTSVPTTEEETSQNTTTTKKKASTTQKPEQKASTAEQTEKKAESTTKTDTNKPIQIHLMTYGPIPNPSNTGGYYIIRRNADNFREDPNGGYLFDVWAEIANNKHYNSIPDHPIEGRLAFSVRTFDDEFIVSDVIDVGTLQPGESKKGTVTVHVDEDKGYQVYFYTI